MNQGHWVTLHLSQPMPLADGKEVSSILGYLEASQGTAAFRLTQMVTKVYGHSMDHVREGGRLAEGTYTIIHHGTWLIMPQFVWMVEYEQEAPIEGFVPKE